MITTAEAERIADELAVMLDGRELNGLHSAALNRSGGAIGQDPAPYWRELAAFLRRAADLADQLAQWRPDGQRD